MSLGTCQSRLDFCLPRRCPAWCFFDIWQLVLVLMLPWCSARNRVWCSVVEVVHGRAVQASYGFSICLGHDRDIVCGDRLLNKTMFDVGLVSAFSSIDFSNTEQTQAEGFGVADPGPFSAIPKCTILRPCHAPGVKH